MAVRWHDHGCAAEMAATPKGNLRGQQRRWVGGEKGKRTASGTAPRRGVCRSPPAETGEPPAGRTDGRRARRPRGPQSADGQHPLTHSWRARAPNLIEPAPAVVEAAPNLVEPPPDFFEPSLVLVGSVKVQPNRPKPGRTEPILAELKQGLNPCTAWLTHCWSNVHAPAADFEHIWPKIGQVWPNSDQL